MTLHHLRVVNLGVVNDSSLELVPGLNVISGETGAGKTLILGGLRLLLGEKADSAAVGPVGSEALIEGLFVSDDVELAVTRIVPRDGRSRAYIDGVLGSVDALTERVGSLVDVVGQHDQHSLKRPGHVQRLVDNAGGESLARALDEYRKAWEEYQTALKDQAALGGDEMSLRRELDLTGFQAGEIEAAGLEPDEDRTLEAEAVLLRNVGELKLLLGEALDILDRMGDDGGEVVARVRKAGAIDPSIATADDLVEQLSELSRSTRHHLDRVDDDPERLGYVESRLTTIGDLKRKYGQTVEEILEFGAQARARADEIERLLSRAGEIGAEIETTRHAVIKAAGSLTEERKTAADRLAATALAHLHDLGMDGPIMAVRVEPIEPGPNGADRIAIWFASDSRLEPVPLGSGASGGELSRLILALRLAGRGRDIDTLVFDEVDAGVGGVTALAMGEKLAGLARDHQVVCVTHLPQVAAFADAHFVVERDGTSATARRLREEARVRELSRMLAGLPDSEAGQVAASELLDLAARTRG